MRSNNDRQFPSLNKFDGLNAHDEWERLLRLHRFEFRFVYYSIPILMGCTQFYGILEISDPNCHKNGIWNGLFCTIKDEVPEMIFLSLRIRHAHTHPSLFTQPWNYKNWIFEIPFGFAKITHRTNVTPLLSRTFSLNRCRICSCGNKTSAITVWYALNLSQRCEIANHTTLDSHSNCNQCFWKQSTSTKKPQSVRIGLYCTKLKNFYTNCMYIVCTGYLLFYSLNAQCALFLTAVWNDHESTTTFEHDQLATKLSSSQMNADF